MLCTAPLGNSYIVLLPKFTKKDSSPGGICVREHELSWNSPVLYHIRVENRSNLSRCRRAIGEKPTMSGNRCGHFSLEIEELRLPHTYIPLRVPIRRCALAEHMVMILSRSEEGRTVATKLTIAASRETLADNEAQDAQTIRVAFGPDLEAIHAPECSVLRCQESCTPSYRLLLLEFGFDAEASQVTEASCLELVSLIEEG